MNTQHTKSSIIHYRISFILLTLGIYLFFFSPLLSVFSTHTTSANDGPLITWLIHQSANFWSGKGELYHWPIFHPYLYTATYSDPFLSLGLLLLPLRLITNNPVIHYNSLLLLSSLSTLISMYILAKELWKTTLTAWITAIVFTFSYLYLQFIVHLHTFFIAGIPLSLFAVIRYLKTKQLRYLILLSAAFLFQSLNSPQTAYFIATVLAVYSVSEGKLQQLIKDRALQVTVIVALAICVWFYIPYFVTAETYDAQRTIRDAAHFSFSITRLLWLDIMLPVLIIGLCSYFSTHRSKNNFLKARTWIVLAGIGALFMLGPVVKIGTSTYKIFNHAIPLPYAAAYYLIPGITAFRAVTRWSILLNFGLSLGIGWLLYHHSLKLRMIIVLLGGWLLAMLLLYQKHTQYFFIQSSPPPIYQTVAQTEGAVLAELPITQWDMAPFDSWEYHRLLYQLKHEKRLYNGASGFMPPARSADIHLHFKNFPNSASLETLHKNNVDLVLVHYDEFQRMAEQQFTYEQHPAPLMEILVQQIDTQEKLQLISCTTIPFDCLYKLEY